MLAMVYLVYMAGTLCMTCLIARMIVRNVDKYDVLRQVAIDDDGTWKYGEIGGFSVILGIIWPIVIAWVFLWNLMDIIGRWAVRRME